MWWRGISESGWGMNLVHQGNTVFATWFTYDADGTDLWLVMDNLQLTGTDTWSGNVYRTSSSPFGVTPYDNSRFAATPVGTATFTFTSPNDGSVTWTVNGTTVTKPITKFNYQTKVPTCAKGATQSNDINYQDLWWRSPALSENGVGYNILHQGDILFVTWFTYDTDGSQMWLFMDSANKTGPGVYTGAVQQARGSPVNQVPYNTGAFSVTKRRDRHVHLQRRQHRLVHLYREGRDADQADHAVYVRVARDDMRLSGAAESDGQSVQPIRSLTIRE
jgi:hypothetical protein